MCSMRHSPQKTAQFRATSAQDVSRDQRDGVAEAEEANLELTNMDLSN